MDLQPANRLREVREARGVSQTELARRVGRAPHTVSASENPLRSLRASSLRRYAAALGVEPRELIAS